MKLKNRELVEAKLLKLCAIVGKGVSLTTYDANGMSCRVHS